MSLKSLGTDVSRPEQTDRDGQTRDMHVYIHCKVSILYYMNGVNDS